MKFLYNPKEITYTDLAIWNNIFQWGYRIINTANMVISRADNDGINWGSGADAENRKNEVLAEARFSVLGLTVTLPIHLVQCPFQHKKLQD